jgi:glycosyltransferase involved in cell wall biosynthesis
LVEKLPIRLAVIVNKDGSSLGPSETFIETQIRQFPCDVVTLIGNPGYRRVQAAPATSVDEVPSRALAPLVVRWLARRMKADSLPRQDTRALRAFFRRYSVDVVLAQYGPTAVSVLDACREADIPLVAHFHGFDAYRHSVIAEFRERYALLFEHSAAIVAVSRHMHDTLVAMGADPKRTYVIPCGADLPAQKAAAPEHAAPRLVAVGRLTEKKAPLITIRAFAEVAQEYPEAVLEVVGDGPLRSACERLITDLRLGDRVIMRGAQPHHFVFEALTRARCFVQHSVQAPDGDREGTPVGIVEAIGMGLPVVATRHGGIAEVVETTKGGILVEEFDVQGMATAMKTFVADASLAGEVGRQGRKVALAQWTSEQSVARLWDVVRNAVRH